MKKSGKFKVGIALVIVQVIAYFGSVVNGSLAEMFNFNGKDSVGKLIELVGFNIPLIIGIILIFVGRKSAERM